MYSKFKWTTISHMVLFAIANQFQVQKLMLVNSSSVPKITKLQKHALKS